VVLTVVKHPGDHAVYCKLETTCFREIELVQLVSTKNKLVKVVSQHRVFHIVSPNVNLLSLLARHPAFGA
jgi:hypothetical protein